VLCLHTNVLYPYPLITLPRWQAPLLSQGIYTPIPTPDPTFPIYTLPSYHPYSPKGTPPIPPRVPPLFPQGYSPYSPKGTPPMGMQSHNFYNGIDRMSYWHYRHHNRGNRCGPSSWRKRSLTYQFTSVLSTRLSSLHSVQTRHFWSIRWPEIGPLVTRAPLQFVREQVQIAGVLSSAFMLIQYIAITIKVSVCVFHGIVRVFRESSRKARIFGIMRVFAELCA